MQAVVVRVADVRAYREAAYGDAVAVVYPEPPSGRTVDKRDAIKTHVAAAGEKCFARLYTKRNELLVMLAGLIGTVAAFIVMQHLGGSGRAESYVAELVMNVFITLAVLGAAYLLPDKKIAILSVIGEASLFI